MCGLLAGDRSFAARAVHAAFDLDSHQRVGLTNRDGRANWPHEQLPARPNAAEVRDDPAIAQVASNIRRLREMQAMTQVDLARRAQIDLRTVTRVERGDREPGVVTLVRIARGLGVEPSALWRDVR